MIDHPGPAVAILIPSLAGGGAERVMLTVAGGLASRGWPIDVVVLSLDGERVEEVPAGVRLVELGHRRARWSVPALRSYLRRRRPSCLMTTLNNGNVLALVARAVSGTATPVVIRTANTTTLQAETAATLGQWAMFTLARRLYARADAVIAPSVEIAEDLRAFASLPQDRVVVAPNPVVRPEILARASEPVDHPWFAPGEPPVVLGVGRLTRQKDFATLLRAVALARGERPCRLLILGEGPQRPVLQRLATALGIDRDVQLPGFEPDPWRFMRAAGVFVLSSSIEGSPGALIEALACGAPVVATDCRSGPREILEDGRHGRLVPVGDAPAMARAIADTLAGPRRPAPSSTWAPYALDVALDAYADALRAVTGRRGARR